MSYENNNKLAESVYNVSARVLSVFNVDVQAFLEREYTTLIECIFVIPIFLIYAFETRYMIIPIVGFVYVLLAFPKIRNTKTDNSIYKALSLYIVIFVWFMLSKLWSGPSYYSDCLWRERDQDSPLIWWMLYSSVAAQSLLLFLPPSVVVDYAWVLNYVFPAMSMVSTCSSLFVLVLRGLLIILMWMVTPPSLKIRSVGLFLVTSWQGWVFFFLAWVVILWRGSNK